MASSLRYFFLISLFAAFCSCDSSNETPPSSDPVISEGLYQKPVTDFETQEPIRTYLAIRDLLASGQLEQASRLTTEPSHFIDTMKQYQSRIGEAAFRSNYTSVRNGLILHSVHHDSDQSLVILEAENRKSAVFFQRKGDAFLEIELAGLIKVKASLSQIFQKVKEGSPPLHQK